MILDTVAFVKLLRGELSPNVLLELESAPVLVLSAASVFEINHKARIGRLEIPDVWPGLVTAGEVAAGEEVVITKRGIPVARLMPPEGASEARRRAAWRRIEALRADLGARDWTPGEFLSARDEGRR